MGISNAHNLTPSVSTRQDGPYGVRIGLLRGDPFSKLLGDYWSRTHWYATAAERDAALVEMSRKHEYSRPGDAPALTFVKVEDPALSR